MTRPLTLRLLFEAFAPKPPLVEGVAEVLND